MATKQIKPDCMQTKRVSSPQLPLELICEILKRLPAKSLMRFKCVCKEWLKTIHDPHFAQLHLSHSGTRPKVLTIKFFILYLKSCIARDYEPCSNIINGLVCLRHIVHNHIVLFNLTTEEKIDLSMMTIKGDCDSYALGFDPISKKYKVLHFVTKLSRFKVNEHFQFLVMGSKSLWRKETNSSYKANEGFEIITLGSKSSWRMQTNSTSMRFYGMLDAISIGERIYFNDYELLKGRNCIQFFDLTNEKFGTIVAPKGFQAHIMRPSLVEVEGNFGFIAEEYLESHSITLRIWVLDKNERNWVEKCVGKDEIPLGMKLRSLDGKLNFYKMTGIFYNRSSGYCDPFIYRDIENIYPLFSNE